MTCGCYGNTCGRLDSPIHWVTLSTYPRTEDGHNNAYARLEQYEINHRAHAHQIIKTEYDGELVWAVQQCLCKKAIMAMMRAIT